jgi:hypothetical protein
MENDKIQKEMDAVLEKSKAQTANIEDVRRRNAERRKNSGADKSSNASSISSTEHSEPSDKHSKTESESYSDCISEEEEFEEIEEKEEQSKLTSLLYKRIEPPKVDKPIVVEGSGKKTCGRFCPLMMENMKPKDIIQWMLAFPSVICDSLFNSLENEFKGEVKVEKEDYAILYKLLQKFPKAGRFFSVTMSRLDRAITCGHVSMVERHGGGWFIIDEVKELIDEFLQFKGDITKYVSFKVLDSRGRPQWNKKVGGVERPVNYKVLTFNPTVEDFKNYFSIYQEVEKKEEPVVETSRSSLVSKLSKATGVYSSDYIDQLCLETGYADFGLHKADYYDLLNPGGYGQVLSDEQAQLFKTLLISSRIKENNLLKFLKKIIPKGKVLDLGLDALLFKLFNKAKHLWSRTCVDRLSLRFLCLVFVSKRIPSYFHYCGKGKIKVFNPNDHKVVEGEVCEIIKDRPRLNRSRSRNRTTGRSRSKYRSSVRKKGRSNPKRI